MEIKKIDYTFKILLLGKHGTGVSSLLLRYAFPEELPFVLPYYYGGYEFKIKIINKNNKYIKLQLWDNPPTGHVCFFYPLTREEYNCKYEYRGAHGFIFVYDISDKDSFEIIKEKIIHMNKYEKDNLLNKNIPKILIGSKCDIDISQRCVNESEAKKFANINNMEYFETSAKNDININETFHCLIDKMIVNTDEDEDYLKGFYLYKTKKRKLWYC